MSIRKCSIGNLGVSQYTQKVTSGSFHDDGMTLKVRKSPDGIEVVVGLGFVREKTEK